MQVVKYKCRGANKNERKGTYYGKQEKALVSKHAAMAEKKTLLEPVFIPFDLNFFPGIYG